MFVFCLSQLIQKYNKQCYGQDRKQVKYGQNKAMTKTENGSKISETEVKY